MSADKTRRVARRRGQTAIHGGQQRQHRQLRDRPESTPPAYHRLPSMALPRRRTCSTSWPATPHLLAPITSVTVPASGKVNFIQRLTVPSNAVAKARSTRPAPTAVSAGGSNNGSPYGAVDEATNVTPAHPGGQQRPSIHPRHHLQSPGADPAADRNNTPNAAQPDGDPADHPAPIPARRAIRCPRPPRRVIPPTPAAPAIPIRPRPAPPFRSPATSRSLIRLPTKPPVTFNNNVRTAVALPDTVSCSPPTPAAHPSAPTTATAPSTSRRLDATRLTGALHQADACRCRRPPRTDSKVYPVVSSRRAADAAYHTKIEPQPANHRRSAWRMSVTVGVSPATIRTSPPTARPPTRSCPPRPASATSPPAARPRTAA